MWLWEEYKYQKLWSINTLELQYNTLWNGLVKSATCARHALRELGFLRHLKKKLQPSTIKKCYTGTNSPDHGICITIWSGGPPAKLKSCSTHSARVTVWVYLHYKQDSITLHWCYFLKSECVSRHKTYKACYQTHRPSQVINFAKSLIQYQKFKKFNTS